MRMTRQVTRQKKIFPHPKNSFFRSTKSCHYPKSPRKRERRGTCKPAASNGGIPEPACDRGPTHLGNRQKLNGNVPLNPKSEPLQTPVSCSGHTPFTQYWAPPRTIISLHTLLCYSIPADPRLAFLRVRVHTHHRSWCKRPSRIGVTEPTTTIGCRSRQATVLSTIEVITPLFQRIAALLAERTLIRWSKAWFNKVLS